MKLPENKRERILVIVAIVVGIVLLTHTTIQLVVSPILESRKKNRDETQALSEKLEKARRELGFANQIQAEYDAALAQIERISAEYVLRPILGSYLVGVSETLERMAREVSFSLDDVQEAGIQNLPVKKKDGSAPAFRSYVVQVGGSGSYEQIIAFLRIVEERNPYLCVTDLRVTGQGDNPERHRVSVRMEWPIEAPLEPKPAGKNPTTGAKGGA